MISLLHDVLSVEYLEEYRLKVAFDDGTFGEWDATKHLKFVGVFAPLADKAFFQTVFIHPECKTLAWGQEAEIDIDPIVLYCQVNNIPLPQWNIRQVS